MQAQPFTGLGPTEVIIILAIFGFVFVLALALTVLPFWMICKKAGFPGWYSLATLIPVLNILLLFFLAFADWPALQQVQRWEPKQE